MSKPQRLVLSLCLKIYIFSDNFDNLNNFDIFRAEAEQAVKGETKVKIIFISCIFLSQFFAFPLNVHVYTSTLIRYTVVCDHIKAMKTNFYIEVLIV